MSPTDTLVVEKAPAETNQAKDSGRGSHRVALDLPSQSYERLKTLKETTEASSFGEVIKNAIRLYEFFVEKDVAGAKVMIVEEGKPPVELKLFS